MPARILNSKFLILNSAAALAAAVLSTAGCRGAGAQSPRKAPATELKPLTLTPAKGAKPVAGAEVDAVAAGLPPNRTVDLMWETVDGGWVVEDGYRFRGKRFTESSKALGRAQVDAAGRLATHFNIPEDFGGMHAVTVVDALSPASAHLRGRSPRQQDPGVALRLRRHVISQALTPREPAGFSRCSRSRPRRRARPPRDRPPSRCPSA